MGSGAISANNVGELASVSTASGAADANNVEELASVSTEKSATNAENAVGPVFANMGNIAQHAQNVKICHAQSKGAHYMDIVSASPGLC